MPKDRIEKEKSYLIKIPVYTSEIIDRANDLFGGVSYADMIEFAKKKIESYKQKPFKISKNKRNKAQTKEIDKIDYKECKVGIVPALLIKVSAYNTNLHDGYVEIDERIPLQLNNKVGSDTNYFLLYPNIVGIDVNNYKHHWLVLIYEDPFKDAYDILNTVKIVLSKILEIKTANIKLAQVLAELKKLGSIPELQIKLSMISFDDNDVDIKYRSYLVKSKLKKVEEDNYKNLPFESTSDILGDVSYQEDYQKREVRIIRDEKEYRIISEMKNDAANTIQETIEEVFNYPIPVSESEFKNIFDENVIISNFTTVLEKYLTSSDGQN